MPLGLHVSDFAQNPLVHHVFHGLIKTAIPTLQADLKYLFRMVLR